MGIGAGDDDFARLDRLAEGFKDGSGKFGEFVEEKNPVMRQADLPRFRAAPAADDRGHGGGVVRFAKGARAADPAFVQQAGQRMDHRGFQRLGRRERRQNAGQAGRQHRLARPRRADHQKVVPPGRRDFQRALGPFLPLYVAQVAGPGGRRHLPRPGGRDGRAFGEMGDHLIQRRGADHLGRADPGGLWPTGARAEEPPPVFRRRHRGGQRADHRHQPPVQRQLPQCHGVLHLLARDDVDGGEERKRDGQVEMRPFLGQVGGREVDGDPLRGQRYGERRQRGAHPVARLADGLVGQAHDRKGGHPGRNGALHLDNPRLHPLECDRIGARNHPLTP